MNKTAIISAFLCLAMMPAMASAGIFGSKKKSQKRKTKQPVEQVVVQKPKEEAPKTFTLSDPVKQLSGEWTIIRLKNKKVSTEERPFLNFEIKSSRLYGNNGCNVINASFRLDGNLISFANIAATSRECSHNSGSRGILKALSEVHSLTIEEIDGVEHLHLMNKSSHNLLTLVRKNYDSICGPWIVTDIEGEPTLTQELRIVIDTDQLKVHGNTGCNVINGDVVLDYERTGGIQFENIISTRKMGYNINRETALLIALEETVAMRQAGNSSIELLDKKGNIVAKLSRLDLKKQ